MYAMTLQDALRSRIKDLERFVAKLEVHRTENFAQLVEWNIEEVNAQIEVLRAKLGELA